jgi:hypothetical protein
MASGGAEPPRGEGAPHGAAGHVKLEHAPGGSQAQVLQLLWSAEVRAHAALHAAARRCADGAARGAA